MEAPEPDCVSMRRSSSYGLIPPDLSDAFDDAQSGDNKQIPDSLRIALIGKTGAGKSSSGNTILGRKELEAKTSWRSITQICQKAESTVDGRHVAIVDTPGLFDTSASNEKVLLETAKSISFLAPGPHAFLLVLQIGRFTAEERQAVELIKTAFGENARKYTMILFTNGDTLEDDGISIDEYLNDDDDGNKNLSELVSEYELRYHVFNNRNKDRTQVKELLQKIDDMVKVNGGSFYTNEDLQEAEEAIKKEKERIMKEKEEERRREEEMIRKKYEQEMEKMMQKERQRQEKEKKQMEKKLGEMDLKIKQEQELREREKKEIERNNERFKNAARRQAESENGFIDNFVKVLRCSIL